jgi:hypothetical protein
MFLPAFRMSSRETRQIITCQKGLFDLNSKGMGGFSGTTKYSSLDQQQNNTFKILQSTSCPRYGLLYINSILNHPETLGIVASMMPDTDIL